jgi:soluble lytic murein transglycosylase-like protein
MKAFALTLALVLGFSAPALAHTAEEQEAWYIQWEGRAMQARYGPEVMAELADFVARHTIKVSTGPGLAHQASPPGPVEYSSGVEQWRGLVAAHWPADQVDRALRIMNCESLGDPYAYNRSGASGLFQLMPIWYQGGTPYGTFDPFNPEMNVAAAAWLWSTSGWAPWVCR